MKEKLKDAADMNGKMVDLCHLSPIDIAFYVEFRI